MVICSCYNDSDVFRIWKISLFGIWRGKDVLWGKIEIDMVLGSGVKEVFYFIVDGYLLFISWVIWGDRMNGYYRFN